jgi:hypothetical protein
MDKTKLTELQANILDIIRENGSIPRIDVARRLQMTVRAVVPAIRALMSRNLVMHDETGFLRPVIPKTHKTTSNTTKRVLRIVKTENNNKPPKKSKKSLTIDEILESGIFRRPGTDIISPRRRPVPRRQVAVGSRRADYDHDSMCAKRRDAHHHDVHISDSFDELDVDDLMHEAARLRCMARRYKYTPQ